MRHQFRFLSVTIVCLGIASAVTAGIIRIDITPDVPVVVGYDLEYIIFHTLEASAYSAQRRCLALNLGSWIPDPAEQQENQSFMYQTRRVGVRDFYGGAFELTNPADLENPPNYVWSYTGKQVNVIGPDHDTFTGPMDSVLEGILPTHMVMDVRFPVFAGNIPIGAFFDGYPQERIRRPQLGDDGEWLGTAAFHEAFHMDGSEVFDHKFWIANQNWENLPVGATFDDFFQQNRLVIWDCTATEQFFTFPERHFRKVKSGQFSFQLVEVTN